MACPPLGKAASPYRWKRRPTPLNSASALTIFSSVTPASLPTAIAELQRALRLDPDDMRARYLLAQAWLAAGEADKALEAGSDDAGLAAGTALLARSLPNMTGG